MQRFAFLQPPHSQCGGLHLAVCSPSLERALHVLGNESDFDAIYKRTALRLRSAFSWCCGVRHVVNNDEWHFSRQDKISYIFNAKFISPLSHVKKAERGRSISRWHQRWDQSEKGLWTYMLIPSIREWLERKPGEITPILGHNLLGAVI